MKKALQFIFVLLCISASSCGRVDDITKINQNSNLINPHGEKIANSMRELADLARNIINDKYGEGIKFEIINIDYPYLSDNTQADYAKVQYTTSKGVTDSFLAFPALNSKMGLSKIAH